MEELNARCFDFLKLMIENHLLNGENKEKKEFNVLAVSHGGYLR